MNLINRTQCREYVLQVARRNRPGLNAERVSSGSLDLIEQKVQSFIARQVEHLPTDGKTIRFQPEVGR